jgi:hypothetical protein
MDYDLRSKHSSLQQLPVEHNRKPIPSTSSVSHTFNTNYRHLDASHLPVAPYTESYRKLQNKLTYVQRLCWVGGHQAVSNPSQTRQSKSRWKENAKGKKTISTRYWNKGVNSKQGSEYVDMSDYVDQKLAEFTQSMQEFVLSRPEWMDGNPKLFSTEQLKVRYHILQVMVVCCFYLSNIGIKFIIRMI